MKQPFMIFLFLERALSRFSVIGQSDGGMERYNFCAKLPS